MILAEAEPGIQAVGITDYFTTASYHRAAKAWRDGAAPSIRLLFPNVELRLDVATQKAHAVNLHLLCDPDDVDELETFLASLEFTYRGKPYRAEPSSLRQLGRTFAETPGLDDAAAMREGVNQFKINFENLRKSYVANEWAMESCLVAVTGGQGDGTSGVRSADGAFEALRQQIERFAHIIFSGNPNQQAFWLGKLTDSPAELVERYGGLKLCLHGSDAHTADRLGVPDQERFTWLKGNASFEALRQACIAPQFRSYIGPKPPFDGEAQARISQIKVDSPGWFTQGAVPINTGPPRCRSKLRRR